MRRRSILLSLTLFGPLTACDKKDDMSPGSLPQEPNPVESVEEEKRLKRPLPARSGISSDPNNPSGAPGSGTIGTSPIRY
jgi:hypothetical protein